MKRATCPKNVLAAELRMIQSAKEFRNDLQRVRGALHAKLAGLPVLAVTSVATGLFGYWLARRRRSRLTIPARAVPGSSTTSALRLMLAFMTRHGLGQLLAGFRHRGSSA